MSTEILNHRVTKRVAKLLHRMREYPLECRSTLTMTPGHGGRSVRASRRSDYKCNRWSISPQTLKGFNGLLDAFPKLFDGNKGSEYELFLSDYGMRMWVDNKGSIYIFDSAEDVTEKIRQVHNDAKRKYIKARKFPTCYLCPSIDMLVSARNYIEANLVLHGYGTTGEPLLQIPTPEKPGWDTNHQKYVPFQVLMRGFEGNLIAYTPGRGGAPRIHTQPAAAFDGYEQAYRKIEAELQELGLL